MSSQSASSLNIVCSEHNAYVQHVCLMNQCYQKLLCEQCATKHRGIHKNTQIPLIELVNSLRTFVKVKLSEEDEEDLSALHEQIKQGSHALKTRDGKPHEINYQMLQNVNGRELDVKYKLFSERALAQKNKLVDTELQRVANELSIFQSTSQRLILTFEKQISESLSNQLKRATSLNIMDEKFLKESSINVILDDLKNNTSNRFNALSKHLQKLHKGFLELKISKKIFKDMCTDTVIRLKTFQKNLTNFFAAESNKLFSFMIDLNDLQQNSKKQPSTPTAAVNDTTLQSTTLNNNNAASKKPEQMTIQELNFQLAMDQKNPNLYMQKMINDLDTIREQTIISAPLHYDESGAEAASLITAATSPLQSSTEQHSPNGLHTLQLSSIKEHQKNGKNNKSSKNDPQTINLIAQLNYQKKKVVINYDRIEKDRFSDIHHFIKSLASDFTDTPISIMSINRFYGNHSVSVQSATSPRGVDNATASNLPSNRKSIQPQPSINNKVTGLSGAAMLVKKLSGEAMMGSSPARPSTSSGVQSQSRLTTEGNRQLAGMGVVCPVSSSPLDKQSDFNNVTIQTLALSPLIRTFGFLEQLHSSNNSSFLFKPLSSQSQKGIIVSASTAATGENSPTNSSPHFDEEIKRGSSYSISLSKQGKSTNDMIIGILNTFVDGKFVAIHSTGYLSSHSVDSAASLLKDINLCREISCYSTIRSEEAFSASSGELMIFIAGRSFSSSTRQFQSELHCVSFESKKDRFFQIDEIAGFHSTAARISCIEVVRDNTFAKINMPNQLQLVTDVLFVFSLALFEDVNKEKDRDRDVADSPAIFVTRVAFHRQKRNSSERQIIAKIPLSPNLLLHRLLFDLRNEFLWAHSDYHIYKWRVNTSRKLVDLNFEKLLIVSNPSDVITSMLPNNTVTMITTLLGNIIGIDCMFNRVIQSDVQKFKYRAINSYAKIEGKDEILIVSGSKAHIRAAEGAKAHEENDIFFYSTLSSAGVKTIAFNAAFKDLNSFLTGQKHHTHSTIYAQDKGIVIAVEGMHQARITQATINLSN